MITFDFLQKIHRLVEEVPERRKEYEILYPDAFEKTNITEEITSKIYGSGFFVIRLYDGDYCFAELKPFLQEQMLYTGTNTPPKKKTFKGVNVPCNAGYEVEIRPAGSYGFKVWRYGKKEKIIKLDSKTGTILEFVPAAEKNRIKEKS